MERLEKILIERMELYPEIKAHVNFKKRLKWELVEIEVQDVEDYFINLYQDNKKNLRNENNLLVCKLLGICEDVNLDAEPAIKMGEYPDVDVDYLPIVRDYLKNTWAPTFFGADKVCNIGSYGTFGLKSTLIDMARVHGLDRNEILKITKDLNLKDDEGESLTFEKAIELYPDLKLYCNKYPHIAKAVQKLLHRNRSMGKHAGGLILCNQAIDKFVPLVRGTEGEAVSSWVEGLSGQDLGPVGLIKFDLLVVNALWQIALAVKFIKERHNLAYLCAYEGQWDWSDLSYLNDSATIAMADKADLKCIFQYDSDGMRKLVRKGGVDKFDDLVAYVAIYRPSALDIGADVEYVQRKKGIENYEIPEILEEALGETYGVFIYQEQVMQVLNIVGKIPLRDCYQVIKAISKKNLAAFQKYEEKFIENGQITLGKSKEEMEDYWQTIKSWAGYGFNKSHACGYSYISARQLYLKSHYLIEFYVAALMCEKGEDKLREYITEACNHGIEVCSLNLNKSKENFCIVDDKIYIGFSNIKGIGPDKAKKIVSLQPYAGFEDFLTRFGIEGTVLRALIPLGIFDEADPETLYKFWILFSDYQKTVKDKKKRFEASLERITDDLKVTLPAELAIIKNINKKTMEVLCQHIENRNYKNKDIYFENIAKMHKKYEATASRYFDKPLKPPFSLDGFNAIAITIEIEDQKVIPILKSKKIAEETYYGYRWENRIKKIKGYRPNKNFANLMLQEEKGISWSAIICEIIEVNVRKFKNKSGQFVSITVMDDNFEIGKITIWEDDYERFNTEIKKDYCISIHVCHPSNGFSSYTFMSPPKHKRHELPKEKKRDYRLVLLEEEEPNV